jgi:hypothetical protein
MVFSSLHHQESPSPPSFASNKVTASTMLAPILLAALPLSARLLASDLLGLATRYAAVKTYLHDVTSTSIRIVHSIFMMAKIRQSTW